MNYQCITFEFPELTDEAAASLHKFIDALMHAVDDKYYQQIHRYYVGQLDNMLTDTQPTHEDLDNPPF